MTELDDRLARLAERRAAASPSTPSELRPKHKHPAALSRVVVASLSWCAFSTIVAAIALQTPAGATKTTAPVVPLYTVPSTARTARRAAHATPTTIVVKKRRHIVYVDQHGAPLTAPPSSAPQYHAPAATWSSTPAPPATPAPQVAAPVATNAPATAWTPVATRAPTPTTKPAPPKVTPTTVPHAPPPPPPPPCSGSKCP
jgi:hypothetical protein